MPTPSVYLPEITTPPAPVEVPTSVAAFIGRTVQGAVNEPVEVNRQAAYEATFGLDEASGVSWQVRAAHSELGANEHRLGDVQAERPTAVGAADGTIWPPDWPMRRSA